jgi:hypothetical protein
MFQLDGIEERGRGREEKMDRDNSLQVVAEWCHQEGEADWS